LKILFFLSLKILKISDFKKSCYNCESHFHIGNESIEFIGGIVCLKCLADWMSFLPFNFDSIISEVSWTIFFSSSIGSLDSLERIFDYQYRMSSSEWIDLTYKKKNCIPTRISWFNGPAPVLNSLRDNRCFSTCIPSVISKFSIGYAPFLSGLKDSFVLSITLHPALFWRLIDILYSTEWIFIRFPGYFDRFFYGSYEEISDDEFKYSDGFNSDSSDFGY